MSMSGIKSKYIINQRVTSDNQLPEDGSVIVGSVATGSPAIVMDHTVNDGVLVVTGTLASGDCTITVRGLSDSFQCHLDLKDASVAGAIKLSGSDCLIRKNGAPPQAFKSEITLTANAIYRCIFSNSKLLVDEYTDKTAITTA